MEYLYFLGGMLTPQLTVWIVALVFSIILLKRSSGRPQRFLVAGSSLMLVGALIGASGGPIVNYAEHHGLSVSHGAVIRYTLWFSWLMSLPGIICLFYAVWKKFNERIGVEHGG